MGISAADIARAAEAINRHPDLSPAARRVGLELLNHIDRETGLAWPSEARMADALGYDSRTIRRGKAELHALGFLTWIRRGTSWRGRTPLYRLALDRLVAFAIAIKAKLHATRRALQGDPVRAPIPPVSRTPSSECKSSKPATPVGRTDLAAYLTQYLNKSTRTGYWKAPGTPDTQYLTDQQLDRRASERIWAALRQLGDHAVAQFIAHPDADTLEARAIKAERFQPGTGLATLNNLLQATA